MVSIFQLMRILGVFHIATTPALCWMSNHYVLTTPASQGTLTKLGHLVSLRNVEHSKKTTLSMVLREKEKETTKALTPEETTEKYGLEAGLFQSLRQQQNDDNKEGVGSTTSATDLLKKYGIAYLATSIPLAIISFAICYVLVDNGVDVSALLQKIPGMGSIDIGENGERVGTAAIAYAAHKAASPLRFPPTVLLTPVVAKLIGKEPNETSDEDA